MPSTIDGVTYSLGRAPLNADKSYQYLLLRLLLGRLVFTRAGKVSKQTTDYSAIPAVLQVATASNAVQAFLTQAGIGGDAGKFVRLTVADNRLFYKDLLSEFANYFMQTDLQSHTSAFVFLYRILERLSFSTPLLYASTQADYVGTFNDLKSLFNQDTQGELGLFKRFLNQGKFIDSFTLDVVLPISFVSATGNDEKFFLLALKHHNSFVTTDRGLRKVEIKFREIPELLKTLRNRFFHFRTGDAQSNIRLEEVLNTDEFFASLNPTFCCFLAFVTLKTLEAKYKA